ncbi:MAG: tetratricopeptide repeat protein [Lentimicrobiaceae bacterium]|nr:tetratricopeptide repeat protein [Lentimicrobiaceae bacterium]
MKHLTTVILLLCIVQVHAQIPLKGVITVQNSKTNTGTTEFVSNAQVECDRKSQPKTSDSKGEFTLEIVAKQNEQIAISVALKGKYENCKVVNEKEIRDLTLGRTEPVKVYVCQEKELEERRASMVDINMKKYKTQIEQLRKELDNLRDKYDYDNPRYALLENQIDSLRKAEKDMYLLVREWAESLTTINLDDANEKYVKAFTCFAQGYLDSISFYLPDNWLKQQKEQLMKQQAEGMQKLEAGKLLTEAGQRDIDAAKTGLADNVKSWMLKAKAAALENKYDLAISYYEEAIHTDTSNTANRWEFANYLYSIREYAQAEKQYLQCLERYRVLEKGNTKAYLPNVATALNNLGNLHYEIKEYSKALEEHEEALKIRRKLAEQSPAFLPDAATSLNNLAVLHKTTNQYAKALEEYEEALKIRRKLAAENSQYIPNVATTLNNLGSLHLNMEKYSKALEEFAESLELYKKLAVENANAYSSDLAMSFNNLAVLHNETNQYPKALEEFEEALKIYRKLADENPKAYVPDVVRTLNNLYNTYGQLKDYPATVKYANTCIEYQKRMNQKQTLAENYADIAWYSLLTKEYAQSKQSARQALELDSTSFVAKVNLAHALLFQNRFSEAEKIYKELSQTIYENNETYTRTILEDFDVLETESAVPEERKNDVEKIREMISF